MVEVVVVACFQAAVVAADCSPVDAEADYSLMQDVVADAAKSLLTLAAVADVAVVYLTVAAAVDAVADYFLVVCSLACSVVAVAVATVGQLAVADAKHLLLLFLVAADAMTLIVDVTWAVVCSMVVFDLD